MHEGSYMRLDSSSWCLLKTLYHTGAYTHTRTKNICLHTHSGHHLLPSSPDADETHTGTRAEHRHTNLHTQTYCFISSLALSFPWRVQFRWNVSFNGNGNGITKSMFSCIAFQWRRKRCFGWMAQLGQLLVGHTVCGVKFCPKQRTLLL